MENICRLSLVDSVFTVDSWLKEALLVMGGVVFIALSAQFYIPWLPVPVTGQTLAVLLLAAAYGSRRGTLTLGIYVLAGVLGLPVYASAGLGLGVLIGPMGGYLIGMIASAYIIGWFAERGKVHTLGRALLSFLLGFSAIYFLGVICLAQFIGWSSAIFSGFIVFMPVMAVKLIIASALLPAAWKLSNYLSKADD